MSTEIASLYARIGADLSGVTSGLAQARSALNEAGSQMTALGTKLSLGVTAPIVAIGGGALKAATEFETSMSRIRGLTNTTEAEFAGMSAQVLGMSKEFPQSAKELADGLYFISSSGLTGGAAMEVLRASAQAAAGGLGETKTVADAVTTAINAYGPANITAAHAVDVLTQAVIEGKGEPAEFAGAFGRVLPIASAAGVSFDQVAASMATMTRTGLSTEEAATALRGILGALVAPGKEATDTLSALGLSTNALRAEIRDKGLLTALADLNARASQAANGVALSTAPVQVNAKALQSLNDKVTDLTSSIAIEEKQVRQEADAIALAGKENYWAANVMQAHQTKLEGMNRTLAINKRELAQAEQAITDMTSGTQKNTLAGQDSVAILDKIIPNIRALTGVLSTTVSQGGTYQTTLDNITNSAGATGKAFEVASQNASFQLDVLKNNLSALGIEFASQLLPKLTPFLKMLSTEIPNAIKGAVTWFNSLSPQVRQLATVLAIAAVAAGPVLVVVGTIATILGALLSPIGLVVLAIAGLAAIWTLNLGGIQEITATAFAGLSALVMQLVNAFQTGGVQGLLVALGQMAAGLIGWVATMLPAWASALGTLAGQAAAWVLAALPGLMANLGTLTGTLLAWVLQASAEAIAWFVPLAAQFVGWIMSDVVPQLGPALEQITAAILLFLLAAGIALAPAIQELANRFWSWVTAPGGPADQIGAELAQLWARITGAITQFAITVRTTAESIGKGIVEGIKGAIMAGLQGLINTVTQMVNDAIAAAKRAAGISSPSTVFAEMGTQMMAGLAQGIAGATNMPIGALQNAVAGLSGPTLAVAGGGVASSGAGASPAPTGGGSAINNYFSLAPTINNGMDVEELAYRIARIIQQHQ